MEGERSEGRAAEAAASILLKGSRDLGVHGINWINAELPLRTHKSLNNQVHSPFWTPPKWERVRCLPKAAKE